MISKFWKNVRNNFEKKSFQTNVQCSFGKTLENVRNIGILSLLLTIEEKIIGYLKQKITQ